MISSQFTESLHWHFYVLQKVVHEQSKEISELRKRISQLEKAESIKEPAA